MMQSGSPPHTRAYYLERAAECERLAGAAISEDSRKIFQGLAARWRSLADEEKDEPPPR
jgi:hypothetical protein